MKNATLLRLAALTAAAISSGATAAQAETQFAVSGSLGTTGGTVEGPVQVNDYLGFRGGYNYLSANVDETYDDIAYEGDFEMSTFGAFIDLRPFKNSFLLTGGAFLGDKTLDGIAKPLEPVEIGDLVYTPDQIGTLDMTADIGDTSPFVGLGFDSTFQGDGHWGFKLIAGAMFTESPSVTLTSTGGTLSDAEQEIFLQELEKERQNLEDDVEDFKVYPVLQAGLTYRF